MTNRILLIGLGKMGIGIATFLQASNLQFDILDTDKNKERDILKSFSKASLKQDHLAYDTVILSLPPKSLKEFIIKNHETIGKIFLSITRLDYHNIAEYKEFNDFLIQNKITLVCGLGLEPGLTEICTRIVARDKTIQNLEIYCGGIPLNANPPFYYNMVFGNKFPTDLKPAFIKSNDKLLKVRRFDDLENIFIPNIGLFESYADGLIPFFADNTNIPNIKQKTIRWPGFANTVKTLNGIGMLSNDVVPNIGISPNDFLHLLLKKNQVLSDDMVILHIKADEKHFTLISRGDKSLSAMAKTTAFPICFAITFLGNKTVDYGITWGYDFFKPNEAMDLINKMKEKVLIEVYE